MKKTVFILLLIFICALGFSACTQETANDQNSAGAGQVNELETVYIGALLPLAGANAQTVQDMQTAMQIAADIINNRHDIDWDLAQNSGLADYGNARVELVFKDCGTSSKTAAAAATELIEMGVPVMVGAYDSDLTAAAALPCFRNGIPMICGSAKSIALTDGSTLFAENFNRIANTDALETALFLDYINQLNLTAKAGIKKVSIAYINNDYGIHAADTLKTALAKTNLETVALISYEPGETDLADKASKMIINEPDAILQISSTNDLISFANFYAQAKYQPKVALCYTGGFQSDEFATAVKNAGLDFYTGAMVCPDLSYTNPDAASAESDENASAENTVITAAARRVQATAIFFYINNLYRERSGKDMSNAALLEFASVIVAAQAVNMAGTTDKDTLSALLKEGDFPAPYLYSGSIAFDDNGQNSVMPAYLAAIINGKYSFVY